MDTLRGSLETFGLGNVVRLIAGSGKKGVLTAESYRLRGRVFLAEGFITYATTRGDDGVVEELRQLAALAAKPRRERRGRKETSSGQTVEDLVEQQVVEVFVRLMRMQGGKFAFDEGVETGAYGDEMALAMSPDKILALATERTAEWEDIETVVPTPTTRFRLNKTLGEDEFEITLDARSWTFLAAVGDSASVQDLAERLRIFEFPAAKKVAEFVRRGLLVPVETRAEGSAPAAADHHGEAATPPPAPGGQEAARETAGSSHEAAAPATPPEPPPPPHQDDFGP